MTAESIRKMNAAIREWLIDRWGDEEPGCENWRHDAINTVDIDRLRDVFRQAIAAAVEEDREACCADICSLCRQGIPIVCCVPIGYTYSGFYHRQGKEDKLHGCEASFIRARGKHDQAS